MICANHQNDIDNGDMIPGYCESTISSDITAKHPAQNASEVKSEKKPEFPRKKSIIMSKLATILGFVMGMLAALPSLLQMICCFTDGPSFLYGYDLSITFLVLLSIIGAGYITLSVLLFIEQRKNGNKMLSGLQFPREISVLSALVVMIHLVRLVDAALCWNVIEINTDNILLIPGFVILFVGLLIQGWKQLLQSKTAILSVLAFVLTLALSGLNILTVIIAVMLLLAGCSLVMTLGLKNRSKKQGCIFCILAMSVLLLFAALSIVSSLVIDSRSEQIREKLKDKIFVYDKADVYDTGVCAFDSDGQIYTYRTIGADNGYDIVEKIDGDPEDARDFDLCYDWFGFGNVYIGSLNKIVFNTNKEPVALFDRHCYYRLSDTIPAKYLVGNGDLPSETPLMSETSPLKTIPDSAVLDIVLGYKINIGDGLFKIPLEKVLEKSCPDYTTTILTGKEAVEKGYFTETDFKEIFVKYIDEHETDYEYDIDYVRYVIISGDVAANPQFPYMTTYNEKAVESLMLFNKNEYVFKNALFNLSCCENLSTAATLIASGNA